MYVGLEISSHHKLIVVGIIAKLQANSACPESQFDGVIVPVGVNHWVMCTRTIRAHTHSAICAEEFGEVE